MSFVHEGDLLDLNKEVERLKGVVSQQWEMLVQLSYSFDAYAVEETSDYRKVLAVTPDVNLGKLRQLYHKVNQHIDGFCWGICDTCRPGSRITAAPGDEAGGYDYLKARKERLKKLLGEGEKE